MLDKHNNRNKFDEGVYAFVNSDFDTAVDRFTEAIEEEPEFAMAYVSRGAAFARLERQEDSIGDFGKAIELKPDYARAYHLRGLEYEKSGDHEKALKDFDQGDRTGPRIRSGLLQQVCGACEGWTRRIGPGGHRSCDHAYGEKRKRFCQRKQCVEVPPSQAGSGRCRGCDGQVGNR